MAVACDVRPELPVDERLMRPTFLPNPRVVGAFDQHRFVIMGKHADICREHLKRTIVSSLPSSVRSVKLDRFRGGPRERRSRCSRQECAPSHAILYSLTGFPAHAAAR